MVYVDPLCQITDDVLNVQATGLPYTREVSVSQCTPNVHAVPVQYRCPVALYTVRFTRWIPEGQPPPRSDVFPATCVRPLYHVMVTGRVIVVSGAMESYVNVARDAFVTWLPAMSLTLMFTIYCVLVVQDGNDEPYGRYQVNDGAVPVTVAARFTECPSHRVPSQYVPFDAW